MGALIKLPETLKEEDERGRLPAGLGMIPRSLPLQSLCAKDWQGPGTDGEQCASLNGCLRSESK